MSRTRSSALHWSLYPAARFMEFAADWDALARAGAATPALASELVAPLLDHFGEPRAVLACCHANAGSDAPPLAMGVLAPAGRGWSTLQPPQAPLGLWLQGPGQDTSALLRSLLRALPGWPALVALTQLDPDLLPRQPDAGRLRTLDYIDTARITLKGDFDDYWQARGKNLRANLKKQRARLEREGVVLRLEAVRDAGAMEAAVADYARLEAAGWKAGGGTAVAPGDRQSSFYGAMLAAFARHDGACVWRYWYGDRVAAMDLCIEDAGCLIVLKTAYDEALAGSSSPALLMREEATRALFEAGRYSRIEFYGRVMEWHLRWTQEIRRLYHVNYYRWPLLARAHAALRARA